jgi:hypothetical protein
VSDLVQSERRGFTLSERSCELPQISRTVLHEIITVTLDYHKVCARWVPKNAHGCTQNAANGFGLNFYEGYHKDGNEFLNHIV